jgi:eukaryotic-like serine/threonine-protein kinase
MTLVRRREHERKAVGERATVCNEEGAMSTELGEAELRITDFMSDMFQVSDPSQAKGNTVTAREILDKASKGIDIVLRKDPELQAQMMNVMGDVYEKLGLYSRAGSLLERSAEIRCQVLGASDPDTLKSMDDLAWVLYRQGHLLEAEKLQREILEQRRRVLGPEHLETAESAMHLAATLEDEGHYRDAEQLEQQALTVATHLLGPEHPFTLGAMTNLAGTLELEARYAEAKTLLSQTLNIERRVLGADHPTTLISMTNLAGTLIRMGQYAEAEKVQRDTLEVQQRVFGPNHPETAGSMYNLACLAARQGHRDEALALLGEAIDHGLAPNVAMAIDKDGDLQGLQGDPRFNAIIAHAREHIKTTQAIDSQ